MIKNALLAAQHKLAAIPELRYVSEDWGQLDYYDQPPVQWPCALIEGEGADYSDAGARMQQAVATLSVRVADLRLFNTSAAAPRSGEAYDIFDLLQKVYVAMQGLSGETFSGLTRTRLARARRDDAIREFVLTFTFAFNDLDAVKTTTKLAQAKAQITI